MTLLTDEPEDLRPNRLKWSNSFDTRFSRHGGRGSKVYRRLTHRCRCFAAFLGLQQNGYFSVDARNLIQQVRTARPSLSDHRVYHSVVHVISIRLRSDVVKINNNDEAV